MKQKETVNPDDVEVTIPTAEPDGDGGGEGTSLVSEASERFRVKLLDQEREIWLFLLWCIYFLNRKYRIRHFKIAKDLL